MNKVKLFEEFSRETSSDLTPEQLDFLKEVVKGGWNINSRGLIDVDGNVTMGKKSKRKLIKKFPVKFGTVSIDFDCMYCTSLVSLEGAPLKVGGVFFCSECTSLVSLEGAPREVGGSFSCDTCTSLLSLKGAPQKIGGDFYYDDCDSLPQEELDLIKNEVLREAWLKSGLSFEEFKKQKKGLIAAKNFGF